MFGLQLVLATNRYGLAKFTDEAGGSREAAVADLCRITRLGVAVLMVMEAQGR